MENIRKIHLSEDLQKFIFRYILSCVGLDLNDLEVEYEFQQALTFAKFTYKNEVYHYYMFDKGIYYLILEKIVEVPEKQYKYNRKLYNTQLTKMQLRQILINYSAKVPFDIYEIDSLLDNPTIQINNYCFLTYWIDKNNEITGKETRTCPQVPASLNSHGYGEYEHAKLYSIDKYQRICVYIEEIPLLVQKTDTNIGKIENKNRFKDYDYYLKLHKETFKSNKRKRL